MMWFTLATIFLAICISINNASTNRTNLKIDLGTLLGNDNGQLMPVGVELLSDNTVLIAGNGLETFNLKPTYIKGLSNESNENSNGTILVLDSSTLKPKTLLKVGNRIDTISVNRVKNHVAIAGSFGLSLLNSDLITTIFVDDLTYYPYNNESDTCGVCCHPQSKGEYSNCIVDIGDDDTIGIMVSGEKLWQYAVYSSSGKKMGNGTTGNNGFTSVNIDSDNKQFFYTSFYDSNTGKEPIVMPCMRVYNYDLTTMDYDDYCFNGHDFRNDSNKYCNGDVADSRAMYISNYKVNGSEYLYYVGRSDGGDTMYFCQSQKPVNMDEKINMTSIDSYTNPYNMNGAAPISFIAQMDIKTGLVNYGQLQNTRLSSGKANGLQTYKLAVDQYGYVYEQQSASCCIDNRGNLTINNERVGNYTGGDGLLLVLSPDFKQRVYWTPFTAYQGAGKTKVVDIKVNNGRVVFALLGNGAMITKNPFSGTKASSNGTYIGYVAVFPTVANQ